MRFQFTLNMPSRGVRESDLRDGYRSTGQNLVHQIYGEHPASDLNALAKIISGVEFLIVEEFYRNKDGGTKSVGNIALNPLFIGKIKAVG